MTDETTTTTTPPEATPDDPDGPTVQTERTPEDNLGHMKDRLAEIMANDTETILGFKMVDIKDRPILELRALREWLLKAQSEIAATGGALIVTLPTGDSWQWEQSPARVQRQIHNLNCLLMLRLIEDPEWVCLNNPELNYDLKDDPK